MFKYLTLLAVVYFFYWLIKQKMRNRKLESQGIVVEQKGMRPITLMSIVMVVMYGGYMIYFLLFQNQSG
ncbi:hypothetical protein THMIRHAM_09730 [Thiomicrorhabdus immobilis]|uniref:Uncharacterized protein n=1 Tax=Thiomicrorhabdus immobilis TaxID=2791037 RepID=A0ABN6CVX3_9GAMM|nr:hypothetical protein [Thiomicrorhabdus immobilis]BCN93188.1 hypothetical protein THMIRHAM_09730 [Thiomicrorhabdus immobilis]